MEKTTIQISKDTLERLKMVKQHPLESYDLTINFLLDDTEAEVLTEREVEEIKVALEQVKRGETIPFEEVLKEANISLS
jgi:hypothetical protein